MINMELKEGTSVFTSGGKEVGRINRFILDPSTNEVTHIVVQKGWLFSEDKVVPFAMVNSATGEKVLLSEDIKSFDQLPSFEESHYINADVSRGGKPRQGNNEDTGTTVAGEGGLERTIESDVSRGGAARYQYAPAYYWYPPSGYTGYPVGYYGWPILETTRNIPDDTIPLREGADIMSSEGDKVGDIERLFVSSDSNRVTHFVISQGLFFKDRKLVPAHWVKTVSEDKVHLAVSTEVLERLPAFEAE